MALELGKVPAAARARYVAVGRRYSSEQTLQQAHQTLAGLAEHGKVLIGYGFALSDGLRLKEARELLIAAGVGRLSAQGERKETALATLAAKRSAKAARLRAHAVLKAVLELLEESGLGSKREAVQSALLQTSFSGDEDEPLARQLDLLRGTLLDSELAKVARDRGGAETVKALAVAADELRKRSAEVVSRGTPAETERLDLIDGIVVQLCRSARRAARVCAKALGQPALATPFELSALDSRPDKPKLPAEPAPVEPAPAP